MGKDTPENGFGQAMADGFAPAFFRLRWQGRMGWRTLFWRDLLLVGSLLSATATLTALVLLSRGQPPGAALAVHLLPLPYGLFMVTSLWRTPQSPSLARWASLLWLALTLLI